MTSSSLIRVGMVLVTPRVRMRDLSSPGVAEGTRTRIGGGPCRSRRRLETRVDPRFCLQSPTAQKQVETCRTSHDARASDLSCEESSASIGRWGGTERRGRRTRARHDVESRNCQTFDPLCTGVVREMSCSSHGARASGSCCEESFALIGRWGGAERNLATHARHLTSLSLSSVPPRFKNGSTQRPGHDRSFGTHGR